MPQTSEFSWFYTSLTLFMMWMFMLFFISFFKFSLLSKKNYCSDLKIYYSHLI